MAPHGPRDGQPPTHSHGHYIVHGQRQRLERQARHRRRAHAIHRDGLAVDRLTEGGRRLEHALPLARLRMGEEVVMVVVMVGEMGVVVVVVMVVAPSVR